MQLSKYRSLSLRRFTRQACRVAVFGLVALMMMATPRARAEPNGVALLPPMGFNSWYVYNVTISESLIESIANQMATNGLLAAGYQYINLDDGWAGYRDSSNVIVAVPARFPDGMKSLADYVHAKGFKFGLYTVGGTFHLRRLRRLRRVALDADTYASWGVDYVKFEGAVCRGGNWIRPSRR